MILVKEDRIQFQDPPTQRSISRSTLSLASNWGRLCTLSASHRCLGNTLSFEALLEERAPKVHLTGTDFQLSVWQELLCIARGQTCTYAELAMRLAHPRAARAVGSAVGANPVAILVPCHRVLPASGGIGGYRWGAELKAQLLAAEGLTGIPAAA